MIIRRIVIREIADAVILSHEIDKLRSILQSADPNKSFNFDGKTTNVGALLADLNKTVFTITDKDYTGINGGYGGAQRGVNGQPNTDTLNMHVFDQNSYGSSTYTDNQGLDGLILHEEAHISAAGAQVNADELHYQSRENAVDKTSYGFMYSNYWYDNEYFARDYEEAAATAIGLNLSQFDNNFWSTYKGSYLGALNMYFEDTGRTF